jgi:di/tricarboxylate transporter
MIDINIEIILSLIILAFTAILFFSRIVRTDVVAVLVLVAIGITKLLPPDKLFAGFSSQAVISLIAIMIMSSGLESSGISLIVAKWLLKLGKSNHKKINLLLMSLSSVLSGFMRSSGTVTLLLPIANKISVRTGITKKFLLMPMTFCAILGGCLTMVGSTPLIILNSLLANINQFTNFATQGTIKPFSLFEVAPIGLCLLIAGIPYLYLMSKKVKSHKIPSAWNGATKAYFARTYSQGTELYELKFTGKSNFIGSTLKQLENKLPEQTSIIALWQEQECLFPALRKTVIKPNAVIAIMGNIESIKLFAKEHGLKLQPKLEVFSEVLHPTRAGLCEAVVPPSSQLIGTEAKELHMKRAYQLHLLGLFRDNKVYAGSALDNLTLRSGDTLGMFSNWEVLNKFKKNPDFFVLTNSFPLDKFFPKKMPYALGFFFLSICLVIFNIFPISVGLLIGAVGMIATGVLSTDRAYDAVSWKTIFFVAGVMPLGVMLEATGTNQWLISLVNPDNIVMSNWLIQLVLIVISSILSLVISNVGTTVLLVPIAVELAYAIGADPRIYALAVALAASNSFIIPTHQVNALIAGPGGYSSYDFQKFGVGMTIIFILILFITLQVFF